MGEVSMDGHQAGRAPRGSTLLVVMIVLLLLALLAGGAMTLSGLELGSAQSKKNADVLVACARGGKNLLLSQFRYGSQMPNTIHAQLAGTDGDLLVATGHYDSAALPEVTMEFKPIEQAGASRGPEDIANKMSGGGATQPTQYVIVCQDPSGRRYELEFTLQFGF
ncbi:MAG TPA: hypothetical protein DFS52_27210 [Myxococcales bacterium]|jgi:hypothetical protein|nr:hypothetical protein [Myxococcales bacterium]